MVLSAGSLPPSRKLVVSGGSLPLDRLFMSFPTAVVRTVDAGNYRDRYRQNSTDIVWLVGKLVAHAFGGKSVAKVPALGEDSTNRVARLCPQAGCEKGTRLLLLHAGSRKRGYGLLQRSQTWCRM